MTRIEYKVELMAYHEDGPTHAAQFLAQLNELGKEGWRLVAVNPLHRALAGMGETGPLPMLLMREVTA
jgi:hypothetical protein